MLACNNSSSSSTTSTSSSATAAASASGHASTLPVSPFPNAPPAPADVGAAPADATKTSSGVASKVLTAGTGKDHPGPTDKVKVHYTGWTKDGKVFDSSCIVLMRASEAASALVPGPWNTPIATASLLSR